MLRSLCEGGWDGTEGVSGAAAGLLTLPRVPLCPLVAAAAAVDAIEGPNTACQEGCPSTAPALPCSAQERICDGAQDSWALKLLPTELLQARYGASSRWLVQGPPVPPQALQILMSSNEPRCQKWSTFKQFESISYANVTSQCYVPKTFDPLSNNQPGRCFMTREVQRPLAAQSH